MRARTGRWLVDRLGAQRWGRPALRRVFPDHWSFLLGEVALYCFLVLVATGTYLTFFYSPSIAEVTYRGAYAPLDGVVVPAAYRSVVEISFDVPFGLLARQVHHWTALVFVAAIVLHLARVFFTGAFRRPRELNWVIGVALLGLAFVNGTIGYWLAYDLHGGMGLAIGWSTVLSLPVVGPEVAFALFGGEFPSAQMLERFFVLHVVLVPIAIAGLLAAHLALVVLHKHTEVPHRDTDRSDVVGERLWTSYASKSVGVLLLTAAVLVGLGGLAQINPVWLYGPFDPSRVTNPAHPAWYAWWIDGAMELMPRSDLIVAGYRVPNTFFAGALLPTVGFALVLGWPFIEARVTGDRDRHDLLDRPRERPVRTAIGVAALAFFVLVSLSAGNDIIARLLDVDIVTMTWAFRVGVMVGPASAGLVTWWALGRRRRSDPKAEALPSAGQR
jgi:ubiquinol-cytochrome c reductase cytochrome b subunit